MSEPGRTCATKVNDEAGKILPRMTRERGYFLLDRINKDIGWAALPSIIPSGCEGPLIGSVRFRTFARFLAVLRGSE